VWVTQGNGGRADGSPLYPKLLAELWPAARHQLCIFHMLQDINGHVLDAVKRMRREMARRGNCGRRRKRGRPTKTQAKRQKKTLKDKAHFVFKHRYLIVKRAENLSETDRKNLQKMLEYLPALRTLRTFMDRIYKLFEADQTVQQAGCRRSALVRNLSFVGVPELAKVIKMLRTSQKTQNSPERQTKMPLFAVGLSEECRSFAWFLQRFLTRLLIRVRSV